MAGKRLSALLGLTLLFSALCQAGQRPLAPALAAAAPTADPAVLELAVAAIDCAVASGMPPSRRLAVIDYSRPSDETRLWVFDLERRALLHSELVAHGRNSGEKLAQSFSNTPGSLQTSIGLFRTAETYHGRHGYSLRLDGLEAGFNDNARERAIVMHGATYVSPEFAEKQGRLGRSWGCPAVRSGVARQMIDTLKGGQFIFSYYPDEQWLASSDLLNCGGERLAQAPNRALAAAIDRADPAGQPLIGGR